MPARLPEDALNLVSVDGVQVCNGLLDDAGHFEVVDQQLLEGHAKDGLLGGRSSGLCLADVGVGLAEGALAEEPADEHALLLLLHNRRLLALDSSRVEDVGVPVLHLVLGGPLLQPGVKVLGSLLLPRDERRRAVLVLVLQRVLLLARRQRDVLAREPGVLAVEGRPHPAVVVLLHEGEELALLEAQLLARALPVLLSHQEDVLVHH
mmetsp:Transcript_11924/g.48030  ORF Transcript_11924/g.48030 Transcript_11924/m.48030 type:complete len:207 (+) Transcript_11924:974-1594(+)